MHQQCGLGCYLSSFCFASLSHLVVYRTALVHHTLWTMSAPILPGPVAMPNTETHHHGYTYDRPPGSEMVDPNGKEEHVHYPMPTKNPADPLNWTRPWKVSCHLILVPIVRTALICIRAHQMITYATVLVYIFCITLSSVGACLRIVTKSTLPGPDICLCIRSRHRPCTKSSFLNMA